jgi:hypothetical protein
MFVVVSASSSAEVKAAACVDTNAAISEVVSWLIVAVDRFLIWDAERPDISEVMALRLDQAVCERTGDTCPRLKLVDRTRPGVGAIASGQRNAAVSVVHDRRPTPKPKPTGISPLATIDSDWLA